MMRKRGLFTHGAGRHGIVILVTLLLAAFPPIDYEHDPAAMEGGVAPPAARVTVRDIGPELGLNVSLGGFIIHSRDSKQILASTPGSGISKSTDGGATWRRANVGLINDAGVLANVVNGLRQDPSEPSTVYALAADDPSGFSGRGLYRTTDFGVTWTLLEESGGDCDDAIADVAIHPTDSATLFILCARSGGDVLFKSTDRGITFFPVGQGLPVDDGGFLNVVIAPSAPAIMYVVQLVFDEGRWGLFKSVDGGETFAQLDSAPDASLQAFPHPADANTLFVQAFFGATGLFVSRDGGASFEEVTEGIAAGESSFLAFDPSDASRIYFASSVGVFRSTDNGYSFTALGLRPEQIGRFTTTVSVDPSNRDIIYVNTTEGNFKTTDGGRRFFEINDGWTVASIRAIAFDHREEPRLFVATSDRLLRTGDGEHYKAVGATLTTPIRVTAIATVVGDRDLVVIASNRGLFRSTDGGGSWTAASIDTGQSSFEGATIAIDPSDARRIYVANASPPFRGLYRSIDSGRSFVRSAALPLRAPNAVAIDPLQTNVIHVGTSFSGSIPAPTFFTSLDFGETFTARHFDRFARVHQIVVDPTDSRIVYVAGSSLGPTFAALLRSMDGGVTFEPADDDLQDSVWNVSIDPNNTSRLIAWVRSFGLFATIDRGENWTQIDNGETLLRSGDASTSGTMALHPSAPDRIYLGGASVLEVKLR